MTLNIEDFIDGKGMQICSILVSNTSLDDFEFTEIERDIYEVALCYAKIFFFETQSILLEDTTEKRLRFTIQTRFDITNRKIEKMSNVDLVAHCIKLEAIMALEKAGLVIE